MGKGIFGGMLITLVLAFTGAYFYVILGCMPANADSKPSWLEKWMAHKSLRATLKREAPKGPNPEILSERNLIAGIQLYAVNCAICHGSSDAKASNIAMGLFQHAPQFADDGVEDDPEGVIFWKAKHGIRLTGMPAFSGSMTDEQLWQITLFLKHMDSLTPGAQKVWKSLPSAASNS